MTGSNNVDVPVLIVGAGPCGLALAIELGRQGIECQVAEQTDGSVEFPTTNLVSVRTAEHLRRWGLVDRIRYAGFPPDFPRTYLFVTRIGGRELARFEHPANGAPHARSPYSPEGRIWCPKSFFDPVLHEHAGSLDPVHVRYLTRVEGLTQHAGRVTAELVDIPSGRREETVAAYVVGCDGGSSPVRHQLGIELQGNFAQGQNVAIHFRSPQLLRLIEPAVMYNFVNPDALGSLIAVDGKDTWRINLRNVLPDRLAALDPSQVVRDTLGVEVPFEIISARPWSGHRVVAERYRDERVFLAGDAVHLLWPTGGFGMNTAIGDAVDLAWKLTATLQEWGGPQLLDSYEQERRPIGMRNVNEAALMRSDMDGQVPQSELLEQENPEGARLRAEAARVIELTRGKEFIYESPGVELGYSYDDSPICVPDGTPAIQFDHASYTPTARPGARAPHAWLRDGRSTLDLFDGGFTLRRLGADPRETSRLEDAARGCGMPLEVVDVDEPDVRRLYEKRLVLVRPDGHVAWRANEAPQDAAAVIATVRGAREGD